MAEFDNLLLRRGGRRKLCLDLCDQIVTECVGDPDFSIWETIEPVVKLLFEEDFNLRKLDEQVETSATTSFLTNLYADDLVEIKSLRLKIDKAKSVAKRWDTIFNTTTSASSFLGFSTPSPSFVPPRSPPPVPPKPRQSASVLTPAIDFSINPTSSSPSMAQALLGTPSTPGQTNTNFNNACGKLPPLDITPFDGDILQFTAFSQSFHAMVHSDPKLSPMVKFQHLLRLLKGDAAVAIAQLSVTDANYVEARKELTIRFGQPTLIRDAHVDAIINLPTVADLRNTRQLQNLYDSIITHTRALRNLGLLQSDYDYIFYSIISRRLPEEIIRLYHRLPNRSDSLHELLEVVAVELRAARHCGPVRLLASSGVPKVQTSSSSRNISVNEFMPRTTGAFFTGQKTEVARMTQNRVNKGPRMFCILCAKYDEHWTKDCKSKWSWPEKKSWLMQQNRCLACAGKDHSMPECTHPFACCDACKGKHFTSLCPTNGVLLNGVTSSRRLVQTTYGEVWPVRKDGLPVVVRMLFDGGSQSTFVSQKLAADLELPVLGTEDVTVVPFGGGSAEMTCEIVRFLIRNNDNAFFSVKAYVVPEVTSQLIPHPSVAVRQLMRNRGHSVADSPSPGSGPKIEVLFGVDVYWRLISPAHVVPLNDSLVAMKSVFGWVLQGPDIETNTNVMMHASGVYQTCITRESDEKLPLDECFKRCWPGMEDVVDEQGELAIPVVPEIVKGRYQVNIPWFVEKRDKLADGLHAAQGRLSKLLADLNKDRELFENYHKEIIKLVSAGHAELAKNEANGKRKRYLAHRAVVRSGTSTDVRVVFDASARDAGGLALNDAIYAGQDRQLDVLKALIKFRVKRWVAVADLEKAFLQIRLREEDRDFTRFLWLSPEASLNPPYEIAEYRMTSVVFGINASPHILKVVILDLLSKYETTLPECVTSLKENPYVDDSFLANQDLTQLKSIIEEAKYIFKGVGFNLRKWRVNDSCLHKELAEKITTVKPGCEWGQVLGLQWDNERDVFVLQVPLQQLLASVEHSKRELLSMIASVYDPLGVWAVLLLPAKILFQKLWILNVKWDDSLPEDLQLEWEKWRKMAIDCGRIILPRWNFISNNESYELHCFADASPYSFGAVLYLKICAEGGDGITFLLSRYKIAPLQKKTVPQLELMAALTAVEVANYWLKCTQVPVRSRYFWTDSTIVFCWICRNNKKTMFVQRRVDKILQGSKGDEWRLCPSTVNPADLPTKIRQDVNCEMIGQWLQGPKWLENFNNWPSQEDMLASINLVNKTVMMQVGIESERVDKEKKVLEVDVRWEDHIKREVEHLQSVRDINNDPSTTCDVYTNAEILIWHKVQMMFFEKEISCLTREEPIPRSSCLKKFRLVLDCSGLLKILSRLPRELFGETALPIILPRNSLTVKSYVRFLHESNAHASAGMLHGLCRERFWIMQGRKLCAKVVRDCTVCKRADPQFSAPCWGLLPANRVEEAAPFTVIGVDYAGPLLIKTSKNKVGKAYVSLFTCATSRAVHLELVTGLNTVRFLDVFKRFMARRGQPSTIYSDNAAYFKKADKVLQEFARLEKNETVQEFFAIRRISWKFIVERAPWMGGFWEKMIGITKGLLIKVIGEAYLNYEELSTTLTIIEGVINARPISFVSEQPDDFLALTPTHLICGRRMHSLPLIDDSDVQPPLRSVVSSRYLAQKQLLHVFSKRWSREYVVNLRHAFVTPSRSNPNFHVDDIVLVSMDNVKRLLFPLARIVSLSTGRDGVVRSALLRLPSGGLLRRPLSLLAPLECPHTSV